MFYDILKTVVGEIIVIADERGIRHLRFLAGAKRFDDIPLRRDPAKLLAATRQLTAYFAGELTGFSLPLAPEGTDFQRRVWDALRQIPYGQTVSYADVARSIGRPKACRAVGNANHKNPIPIIIPCHRVVASCGALGGYAGGLEIKKTLLKIEQS